MSDQKLNGIPHLREKQKLAIMIIKYIKTQITKTEEGLYDGVLEQQLPVYFLKDRGVTKLISELHEEGFNEQAEYYAEKIEPYYTGWMEMLEILDHSIICLMSMVAQITVTIHVNINREELDTSSKDVYLKSVKKYLESAIDGMFLLEMIKMLSHECNGDKDIGEPDENGKYMSFKIEN